MFAEYLRRIEAALDALACLHERLFDVGAGLVRVAPGVTPGIDLSSLSLHAVRETALGAVVDLRAGNVERAAVALDRVLDHQYVEAGRPWSGTFKVVAEEAAPPGDGAVEWYHYDPNWRQFVGCTLAFVVEEHGGGLPGALATRIEDAIGRCVAGEPPARIPDWYTNPALMHAWLEAWVGARLGDRARVAAGEARLGRVTARFDRAGDVDEYNSPTYDGVDLFALALWSRFAPTPRFEAEGARLGAVIGARISALYHPRLRAICGPYIRAYGLSLDRYVSLAGLLLGVAPPVLDERTVHVHDLYFLELFDALGDVIQPHLRTDPVDAVRVHEQRFGPVVATSRLGPTWAIGAERGRVPAFSKDQYVPFTVHFEDAGAAHALGVKLGDATRSVDATFDGDRSVALHAASLEGTVALIVLCSAEPTLSARGCTLGPLELAFDSPPVRVERVSTPTAAEVRLTWSAEHVRVAARLR